MSRARILAFGLGGALAVLLAAAPAHAACTVTANTGVAFGNYNPQSATPDDAVGTVTIRCNFIDPAPNVALGTGGSGTYFPRRMTSGPWILNYNLYTTAAHTIIWGNGTGGTQTVNPPGVLAFPRINYTATIYGRIPALQNVGAGVYGDTVIVTITW